MSGFNAADNYVPEVWIKGITEKSATKPSIINSGIMVKSAEFDALASGPAATVTIPFFRNIEDQDDAIQVERQAPSIQGQSIGKQVAVLCNRETANDLTAMSRTLGALDPLGDLLGQIAARRLKQDQKRLLATLRGTFGVSAVATALGTDNFSENAEDVVSTNVLDGKKFIDAVAKLGELSDAIRAGAMIVHPMVRAGLLKADEKDFFRPSQGAFGLEYYKGVPLFVSDLCARAGVPGQGKTASVVYETFVVAAGSFAYGSKPQVGGLASSGTPAIDVASINLIPDGKANVLELIDRTRTVIHPSGMKWLGGSVAGDTPTNAELATGANWTMAAADARLLGMIRIRTNG